MTIIHPIATEKAIRMMEAENKLLFAVEKSATKPEIKAAIEKKFKSKVTNVQTFITSEGKRAYVTFAKESPALDIATNLGLI
ncbi:50S ribosomal protein L23 [Candidatus Woesearchaeota archaeon]|nr:50S ribosomal protein L23 [Candidatus Woesearchaeota archaeon]